MKKTILLAAMAACLFATNVFAQKIKGSDTCLPLTQTEAENFMNKNKAAKITVTGGGSGVGISALMEGTTDIAMASRKMKFDERMKLQEAGKKTKEEVIAYDALAVVVHPSNKVSNLTREQLEGIFTGKIKNWKEVGGADIFRSRRMGLFVPPHEDRHGQHERHEHRRAALHHRLCGLPAALPQARGAHQP